MQICCAKLENRLYILHVFEPESNYTEIFRVAKPKSNKHQKLSNDNETYLWHLKLGHISLDRINRLTKDGPLKDLSVGSLPVCESCLEEKMTKRPFTTKGLRAEEPLGLVHCNPAKTLYSKIMYKYAQFNEMRTFSYFQDYNKVYCAHF